MNCNDFLAALGAVIWGVRWLNVALFASVLLGIVLLYRANKRSDNSFDVLDLITNDQTHRADFAKISIIVFAALSVWVVVTLVQQGHAPEVVTLLPIVLGIFVGARVLNSIFGKPTPDTTVTTATATTVSTTTPKPDDAPDLPSVPDPPVVTATVVKTSNKSK